MTSDLATSVTQSGQSAELKDRHRFGRCPKCRSWMARAHRRPIERLLYLGIEAQRLRCTSPECANEFLEKPKTLAAITRPWVVGVLAATFVLAIPIVLGVILAWQVEMASSSSAPPESVFNRPAKGERSDPQVR